MSYQSQVLADAPVMYLRFEEVNGSSCADETGNGHTGTANGTYARNNATGVPGIGVGILLGGTIADYVSVPNSAPLQLTGAVTYECCFVAASPLAAAGELIAKGWSVAASGGYNMYVDNTGKIFLNNAYAGTAVIATAAGTIVAGTFYHVAAIRDGSNNIWLYVNGVNKATAATSATAIQASGAPLLVGGSSQGGTVSFPFKGTIDEVAVYNYALSRDRVLTHYSEAIAGAPLLQAAQPIPLGRFV